MDQTTDDEPNSGIRFPLFGWRIFRSSERHLMMRLGILFLLAFITSIPVELRTFESEITNRINRVEKNLVDVVRKDAIVKEEGRLKDENERATGLRSADVEQHRIKLDRQRTQLLEAQQLRRIALQQAAGEAAQRAAEEVSGNYKSRIPGAGSIYRALVVDRERAEKGVRDFELIAAKELDDFDKQAKIELGERETSRNADADKRISASAEKIKEIQKMDADKLTALYGGSWKQPRGFLYRYEMLQAMAEENKTVRWVIWGLRLVMVVFGLFVLAKKLMCSREFARYYSLGAQAAAGHVKARQIVTNMGYGDPVMFGLNGKVRDMMESYVNTCIDAAEAVSGFQGIVRQEARKEFSPGCHQSLQFIIGTLHEIWSRDCQPRLNEMQRQEAHLQAAGVTIPEWPKKLNGGNDPRGLSEPWQINKTELASKYGWIDPDEKKEKEETARNAMVEVRQHLKAGIDKQRTALAIAIRQRKSSHAELLAALDASWNTNIKPVLARLSELEWKAEQAGIKVPDWSRDFSDPRSTLEAELRTPTPKNLHERGLLNGSAPVATTSPSSAAISS